jgi:hypothetical protein
MPHTLVHLVEISVASLARFLDVLRTARTNKIGTRTNTMEIERPCGITMQF